MPGLALAAGPVVTTGDADQLLSAMAREEYRSDHVVAPRTGLAVAFSGPPSYPLQVESVDGVTCALEGAVYGRSRDTIASELRALASTYARDRDAARTQAERWACAADGDFVLCLVSPDAKRALVVNDRLGRLPLYHGSSGAAVAIAREIKSVRAIVGAGDVDRHAIAQLLMFSFPLGTRTMHEGIRRLPEASSVEVDADAGKMDVRRYYEWNFEALASAPISGGHLAEQLSDAFVDRCAAQGAWAGTRPLVVAMSGGLDSRSSAAGLLRAGMGFECVTFESGRRGASEETATAEEIANTLGARWRLYALDKPSWDGAVRLAQRCDGTTNVGMSFLEEFFARLRADFGDAVCQVTGDGGDRAMPDLSDRTPSADREAFVSRRINAALWPIATVARLLHLPQAEIVDGVRAHVAGYPETTPASWQVRYLIADYGWGRIFSGEDRTRTFVWTMTPFYCQSFFEAAMRVPSKAKRDYALYAGFLRALDARVAGVKKSDWGYAPTSPLIRIQGIAAALRHGAPNRLKQAFGTLRRSRDAEENVARTSSVEFLAAIQARPNDVFDAACLADIAKLGCGKTHFHMLETALLYVDSVWGMKPAAKI